MSYQMYTPELGEKEPVNMDGTASLSHYGKHYFINTRLELSGRGIRHIKTLQSSDLVPQAQHRIGEHVYRVTIAAFEKLCTIYNFSGESLLD